MRGQNDFLIIFSPRPEARFIEPSSKYWSSWLQDSVRVDVADVYHVVSRGAEQSAFLMGKKLVESEPLFVTVFATSPVVTSCISL